MWNRSVAAAVLIVMAGCMDRTVTPPDETPFAAPAVGPSGRPADQPDPPIELAQMVAKGLKNPAFRAYLKAQLDASPYREHKLQFETFLNANSARALRQISANFPRTFGNPTTARAMFAAATEGGATETAGGMALLRTGGPMLWPA